MTQLRLRAAVAAVFGLSALSASAADIQLFGFLDQGLAYLHEDLNAGMAGPAGQSINAPQNVDEDGYVARAGKKNSFTQGTGNVSTWGCAAPNSSMTTRESSSIWSRAFWRTTAPSTAAA